MKKAALLLTLILTFGVQSLAQEQVSTPTLSAMQLLDATADFSFAIMSDHKGSAPVNSAQMARMVQWIKQSGDRFVIGLGDHLCKRFQNPFVHFLAEDAWWHHHFYPNIADGENEYYGAGQGDWGAGGKLLDVVDMKSRPAVQVRANNCEYYARVPVGDFVIHLIQLHYPDNPRDINIAFNEDTRQYLINTLNSIERGPKDIIIVCAHSRTGYWVHELSPQRRQIVMEKCDLVLSATTHVYGRLAVPGYEAQGALCLNTGSVNYPGIGCPGGYIQVHVYGKARQMLIQYVNLQQEQRLPGLSQTKVYLKEIGGNIYEVVP